MKVTITVTASHVVLLDAMRRAFPNCAAVPISRAVHSRKAVKNVIQIKAVVNTPSLTIPLLLVWVPRRPWIPINGPIPPTKGESNSQASKAGKGSGRCWEWKKNFSPWHPAPR